MTILVRDYSGTIWVINQTVEQLNDIGKNYSGRATVVIQSKILLTSLKRHSFDRKTSLVKQLN